MKKSTYLLLAILLSCLFSCQEKTSSETDQKLDIHYDLDEVSPATKLSDVIGDYSFIKLQTKGAPLLGETWKVVTDKDKIFIQNSSTNTIEIFANQGNYVRTIGKIGEGPGEYLELTDFVLIPEKETLAILDTGEQKVLFYRFDGSWINDIKIDFFARRFEKTKTGFAFLMSGKIKNMIRFTDDKLKEIGEGYPKLGREILCVKHLSVPSKSDSIVLFTKALCDTIFQLKNNQITPYLHVNLGEYSVGKAFQNPDLAAKYGDKTSGGFNYDLIYKNYFCSPDAVSENDRFIIFFTVKDRKGYMVVHDKNSAKTTHYATPTGTKPVKTFDDITFTTTPWRFFFVSNDNRFISVLPGQLFAEDGLFKPEASWSAEQTARYKKIQQLTQDMGENSNPILMLANFKPIK